MLTGRELQRKLRSFGLRQRAVAPCIGVSPPTLSLILTEKVQPAVETRMRLERLLSLCNGVEKLIRKRLQSGGTKK